MPKLRGYLKFIIPTSTLPSGLYCVVSYFSQEQTGHQNVGQAFESLNVPDSIIQKQAKLKLISNLVEYRPMEFTEYYNG